MYVYICMYVCVCVDGEIEREERLTARRPASAAARAASANPSFCFRV